MKTVAAAVAAGLIVFSTTTSSQQRDAPAARSIANTLVPGPADRVALELPANVFSAQVAFKAALDAAKVRYGLESVPFDPDAPPIDLARSRESLLTLGGRRLGDVLDAIVHEVPQYRWFEVDGTIVVRATPEGQGVLDRRLERFSIVDAPPRSTLEALIAAIDPARPKGEGITGFGRPAAGAVSGPPRIGRNVTLDLKDVSVQTALASIARANGEQSWTVGYDRAIATAQTATITLTELGVSVVAQSSEAMQDRARQASSIRLPISVSLPNMLEVYSRRAGVKVSIEQVAYEPFELPSFMTVTGAPPLELPGSPALAVPKIVALDSRYEWSEKNGRFLVRPKPGVPGRLNILDRPIAEFSATSEPARAVVERVSRYLGMAHPMDLASGPPGRTSIQQVLATPISVDVRAPATARDALDAIADAMAWTWMLQPRFIPGTRTQLILQLKSSVPQPGGPPASSGWSTTVLFTAFDDLSPPPVPTRPPATRVPSDLDRDIKRANIEMGTTVGPFQLLGSVVQVPMVVENPPPAHVDTRYGTRQPPDLVVGPGKFSDALYFMLETVPGFQITSTDGVVGVAPTSLVQSPDYFMNREIGPFRADAIGLFRAIGELRRQLDPAFQAADWNGPGAETWNRPVSVSLPRATPRDVLRELARAHRNVLIASNFVDATPSIDAWTVLLAPIGANGPPVRLTREGGVVTTTLPESPRPRPIRARPLTETVELYLPATAVSMQSALRSVGRATRQLLGVELFMTSMPVFPSRGTSYDLSDLSADEMLRKLVELAPDYSYSLDNGVYHVRPGMPVKETSDWLGQRVDKIDRRFDNVRAALNAVLALSNPAGAGQPVPAVSGTLDVGVHKTIVLSLTNVTIRDLLDEIARQQGAVMWTVIARGTPTSTTLNVSLAGYDGWTISATIR